MVYRVTFSRPPDMRKRYACNYMGKNKREIIRMLKKNITGIKIHKMLKDPPTEFVLQGKPVQTGIMFLDIEPISPEFDYFKKATYYIERGQKNI